MTIARTDGAGSAKCVVVFVAWCAFSFPVCGCEVIGHWLEVLQIEPSSCTWKLFSCAICLQDVVTVSVCVLVHSAISVLAQALFRKAVRLSAFTSALSILPWRISQQRHPMWRDGFELCDYLKAESDIRLLGNKIVKINTFPPAP